MNSHSNGLIYVIAFVVIFFCLAVITAKLRGDNAVDHFDERQLFLRGKAYKAGLITFVICILADAFLKMLNLAPYVDPLGEFAALFAALIVFAGTAIRHDAFAGYNIKWRSFVVIYIIVTVMQLVNSVSQYLQGTLVSDGKLTMECMSVLCFITFAAILVMLLLKYRHDRNEMMGET